MEFVKGFKVEDEIILEGERVTLVTGDGEVFEDGTMTVAAKGKITVKFDTDRFERVFDLKEISMIDIKIFSSSVSTTT